MVEMFQVGDVVTSGSDPKEYTVLATRPSETCPGYNAIQYKENHIAEDYWANPQFFKLVNRGGPW